jgi:chromosome segregation ATPase
MQINNAIIISLLLIIVLLGIFSISKNVFNGAVVLIGCTAALLFGGIIVCLYLMNDLLSKLNKSVNETESVSQQALVTANGIASTASQALTTANQADTNATQALTTANGVSSTANQALETANNANTIAVRADQTVTSISGVAFSAFTKASQALQETATWETSIELLQTDMTQTKTDITGLKADVAQAKYDIVIVKDDVEQTKANINLSNNNVQELTAIAVKHEVDLTLLDGQLHQVYDNIRMVDMKGVSIHYIPINVEDGNPLPPG